MIYLSAQPDDYYFYWQLQVQLYNFLSQGISPASIHVLIAYDPGRGMRKEFYRLMEEYPEVNIHAYTDTRAHTAYPPSIRPHIIAKHLSAFPELQMIPIFYHDSDIVFKGLPDFSLLIQDDVWYVSDTRAYLDSDYIRSMVSESIFAEMCRIVGVTTETVAADQLNAGGAQYLLKYAGPEFWQKVEDDSEKIYSLLLEDSTLHGFCNAGPQIQAWCTDMWVIWWNALRDQIKFRIHPELSFAWANSPVRALEQCKILHYTGSREKGNPKFFRKFDYVHYPPFYTDHSKIDPELSSAYLKQQIDEYLQIREQSRADLSDVTFLMIARIDSEDRSDNIHASLRNLCINFKTNILLTEVDDTPKIDLSKLPPEVQYFFAEDDRPKFHQTKYINQILMKSSTPYLSVYDADAILPVNQILQAVDALRSGQYAAVSPYSGNFLNVDRLLKAIFIKIQDAAFLEENQHKLITASRRSYGGAIFLNKQQYLQAGLENENLLSWGPNDVERIKRLTVLGYRTKRINGNLYHLAHSRGRNSGYQSLTEQNTLMDEYLKICNLDREDLQNYIATWSWKPAFINEK